jgi:hypothetical protein
MSKIKHIATFPNGKVITRVSLNHEYPFAWLVEGFYTDEHWDEIKNRFHWTRSEEGRTFGRSGFSATRQRAEKYIREVRGWYRDNEITYAGVVETLREGEALLKRACEVAAAELSATRFVGVVSVAPHIWPHYRLRNGWLIDEEGQQCPEQVLPFSLEFTAADAERWLVHHDIRGSMRVGET